MDESEGLNPVTGVSEVVFSNETLDFLDSVKSSDSNEIIRIERISNGAVNYINAIFNNSDWNIPISVEKFNNDSIVILDDKAAKIIDDKIDRDKISTLLVTTFVDQRDGKKKILLVDKNYLQVYMSDSDIDKIWGSKEFIQHQNYPELKRGMVGCFNEWWKERGIVRGIMNLVVDNELPKDFIYGGVDHISSIITRKIYSVEELIKRGIFINNSDGLVNDFEGYFNLRCRYAFQNCLKRTDPSDVIRLLVGEELECSSKDIILEAFTNELERMKKIDY